LCAAVCNGVTQLASTLLDSGVDVADIDKYGKTALTNTASCRYEQCVQKLGEAGVVAVAVTANIAAVDRDGYTALADAAQIFICL
jgi:ankyrin repeat protein